LQSLARLGADRPGRTWAVLGEMRELGPEAEALHVSIGRLAAELGTDELVVVGAAAAPILAGWEQAACGRPARLVDDAAAATHAVASQAAAGDTVLVKASNSLELWAVAESLLGADAGQPAGAGSTA
jgi:UDP-N-acetylmuramoyl-tripeptide--D-alanyl-D-alanine ligase